jgi:GNAT superfamily N-acetyltransferase
MPSRLIIQKDDVAIYELLGSGDDTRVEAMLELYQSLFPQYQHYVPRMRRRAQYQNEYRKNNVVHYWLIEVNGQPAGLRTFRYVRNRRCGLAHALAVDPKFREVRVGDKKLAVFVIYECLNQIIRDAKERGDEPVLGMVNEVETDRLMGHYERNGLIKLPLKYIEPIFPPEAEGRSHVDELALINFSPMHMGFLPNPEITIEAYSGEMMTDFVLAFLVDHYGLPENHPAVVEVLNSIEVKSKV